MKRKQAILLKQIAFSGALGLVGIAAFAWFAWKTMPIESRASGHEAIITLSHWISFHALGVTLSVFSVVIGVLWATGQFSSRCAVCRQQIPAHGAPTCSDKCRLAVQDAQDYAF